MHRLKKTAGKREQPPRPGEAAFMAVCNLLLAGKATPEENRQAVRHLLKQASRNVERNR